MRSLLAMYSIIHLVSVQSVLVILREVDRSNSMCYWQYVGVFILIYFSWGMK